MPRKLFVTTALPYANAAFHIGHMMEYIQADTWVRAQRMLGAEVNFVCADDAHGAPIMIAAEKAGLTPQQFVAGIAAGRAQYLDGFHIAFDHWHSTDAPENHRLAQQIYLQLRDQGLIETRSIEQFFDPEKGMFLPDRFIKGSCPKCGAADQYGDNCENCGAVYAPTDLLNPYSALSGATPVLKTSEHFFFKLSDPRCVAFLEQWTQDGKLQPEVANKVREWFVRDETRQGRPGRLGHQPRRALFRHPDPRRAGQVLLCLAGRADRLPGRAGSPADPARREHGRLPGPARPGAGALHRQGHRHLPHPVLAGHAAVQWPQAARCGACAWLPHRQQRQDEQEPRHRHQPACATWSWA